MDVFFLHGLESGPMGSKIQSLRNAGWTVIAPDCQGVMDVGERVAIARAALEEITAPVVVVGSSYGGLIAAKLYEDVADSDLGARFCAVVFCAPAFHAGRGETITVCPPRAVILHGTRDEVVPIEASRTFSKRHGVPLVEVADDHRLKNSHAELLRLVEMQQNP